MTFPPKFILSDLKAMNRVVNRDCLRHAESVELITKRELQNQREEDDSLNFINGSCFIWLQTSNYKFY